MLRSPLQRTVYVMDHKPTSQYDATRRRKFNRVCTTTADCRLSGWRNRSALKRLNS